ncbi:carbonic anhydrase family protein [Stenotrophomonas sp. SORGH_AS_0321]|uniref:carbonic anhydrase n=1 Tax=Stenotrophomonas sp. SORGH_AS_0321 TaxID=3041787 RepID=UPI002861DA38|nr:carbonic anhydrase family protein [Stenotrophomonas sp. SORGH_AS_0321]MDR6094414.1 carbonic anhydrase [Stenotrophomonas sp. SORGH_AS_0321]
MCTVLFRVITGSLLAAASLSMHASADEHAPHWGYEKIVTPGDWAELAPACAGTLQSPIDLRPGSASHGQPHALHANYSEQYFSVFNNGHTLQASPLQKQQGGVDIDGEHYALMQFHVHTPSEHFVDGKPHAMELHMVHARDDGKTAVVAVFFDVGAPNVALAELFERLPVELASPGMKVELQQPMQLASLLPHNPTGLRYVGSLTTPPCTEGVLWNIELTPQTISQQQLDALRSVYPHNARPLQSFNARVVSEESFE